MGLKREEAGAERVVLTRPHATVSPGRSAARTAVRLAGGEDAGINGGVTLPAIAAGPCGHLRQALRSDGGAEGNRTPDLIIANDALSQLSYSPAPNAGPFSQ